MENQQPTFILITVISMLPKKNLKILTADKPLRKSMVIIPIFNPVFEKKYICICLIFSSKCEKLWVYLQLQYLIYSSLKH